MFRRATARVLMRGLMAAFYGVAGVVHLASPAGFLQIMPDWVPFPATVVMVTGICEITGAIGLLTRRFRWWAGVMLAVYAVCVFPANIKHAIDGIAIGGTQLGWWYHGPRFALQPVLVWWALFCACVVDWPLAPHPAENRQR